MTMSNNQKAYPQRMCTGCREMKDKRELVRLVKTKEGTITFDETGKLAGRGAYVCKNQECLEKAMKNKGFERSFKHKIPEEVLKCLSEEMSSFETK